MRLSTGDRVIATDSIGGMLFAAAPKGTKGVITDVSACGGSYSVAFENGHTEKASLKDSREDLNGA